MRSVTAALGPAAPRCGSRPSGCPRPLAVAAPSRRRLPAVARDVATRASPSDDGSSSSGLPPSPSAPSRSPPERPLSSTEAGLTGSADAASAGADLGRIAAAVEALAAAAGPAALPAASDITDLATLLHASVTASAAAAEQQAAALGRLERQAKERAAAAAGQAKLLKELQAQCKLEDQRAQREARAARLRAALAVQCSANPSGLDPHMEEDWKFQDLNRGLLVKRILTEALQVGTRGC
ncbi:hypothetical protein HYH03_002805 [Edaphochlamys debaryana]|uniref:Uncharacterized protein n=1 Tax=Edaphochlamys debaryana TaxID=47281 RepID=A0A836C3W0_9CHLO|nr:hypothetical protein HYH03_002805 [Edaphochlamys debaryana]|eukprot:KAG2499225.1 hypothetical protein HYH03_002805 [Edaphochlamys debaryana]